MHAPRAGCDHSDGSMRLTLGVFQSTHPGRGATRLVLCFLCLLKFQSTHPGRGATRYSWFSDVQPDVSIHAPRAGCDAAWPRARDIVASGFNPRTPGRGATVNAAIFFGISNVSIHAPPGGVRHLGSHNSKVQINVSIHAPPGGVRLHNAILVHLVLNVSIHAPRAGCDALLKTASLPLSCFNPRTPGGVRLSEFLYFTSAT